MRIVIGEDNSSSTQNVLRCAKLSVRERFLRFLFGETKRITIIVPGRSVDTVEVAEVREGD